MEGFRKAGQLNNIIVIRIANSFESYNLYVRTYMPK